MRIGVPKETLRHEHRVGLTPFGVARLVHKGHQVFVERDAGRDSHFRDEDYVEAGASIVYRPEEAYGRADIVCRVSSIAPEEVQFLAPGTTLIGFHHMAVAPREVVSVMMEREISAIGYELIEDSAGRRPVLASQSEIAGRMAVSTAAELLQFERGGRGIILGGVAGVAPATVVVLGAGTVGRNAARTAVALGAHVIVLDWDPSRLREVMQAASCHLVTALASRRNLHRYTQIADVVIGAVMIPGGRAPFLVTEAMVAEMKEGSVILDISIDQGGCVETSRPTTLDNPTFQVNGVTHFCVSNLTTNAPRTASRSLAISAIAYVSEIAGEGLETALKTHPGMGLGAYLYRGRVTNQPAADAMGLDYTPLSDLLD